MNNQQYQNGKMNADDQGQIAMGVGIENGRVVVSFPIPVTWVALPPDQAIALANAILANARKLTQ